MERRGNPRWLVRAYALWVSGGILAVAGLVGPVAPTLAYAWDGYLASGTSLASGASLKSGDGAYALTMQADCNLLFRGPSGTVWSSGTTGAGTGCSAVMQPDGNLVVRTSAAKTVWASGTAGYAYVGLVVRTGRLVLMYSAFQLWASSPDPQAVTVTGLITQSGAACSSGDLRGYEWVGDKWQGFGYRTFSGGVINLTIDNS
jgi:hypothetical protein